MTPRRLRRSESAALALAAVLLASCGGDGGSAGDEAEPTPATERTADPSADSGTPAVGTPQAGPSDYARRAIPGPLLRLYLKTGRDLNLDWWIIAAVDQIDLNAGDPGIPPRERIPGIGYSLAAAGAPHDNEAALAARAGRKYAERVLKLAGRYVETAQERRENQEAAAGS